MAIKFLFLAACVALGSSALVRRDAPSALDELQKHADEFRKTFGEQLNQLINSQNTQELNKALKEGSDAVVQHMSALGTSLQAAMADATGKTKEVLEATRANLERATEDLRRAHPEVEQQAAALKDKLQAAVQNALQETQKVAKEVSSNVEQTNEKLAPKIQAAYDEFVKQAQEVQKKLHDAVNKQ